MSKQLTEKEKAAKFDKLKEYERRYGLYVQLTIKKAQVAKCDATPAEVDAAYKEKWGKK